MNGAEISQFCYLYISSHRMRMDESFFESKIDSNIEDQVFYTIRLSFLILKEKSFCQYQLIQPFQYTTRMSGVTDLITSKYLKYLIKITQSLVLLAIFFFIFQVVGILLFITRKYIFFVECLEQINHFFIPHMHANFAILFLV